MKIKKISYVLLIGILFILLDSHIVYGDSIKKGEYSEKYKEWLKLSDEEKKNTIAPLPINIRKSSTKNSFVEKVDGILKSVSIPSSYDLRDHISIKIEDQENTGACWAFSTNASVETYLALRGENYDFSERHMDYETSYSFVDGNNSYALKREVGSGGYSTTGFLYYSRGSGPVLEEDMPFENNESSLPLYELPTNVAVKKVDNMVYFPSIFKKYDNNHNLVYMDANDVEYSKEEVEEIRRQVKEHIMNYGGVSISINAPDSSYYSELKHSSFVNDEDLLSNHAVIIIGWDDNYSKYNFIYTPKENGAYIVMNSWGDDWGDNGIYYISYEDFLVEGDMRGVSSVSNINYDNLYQHDLSEMGNILEYKYGANVFTSKDNEILTEVLIGSLSDQVANVYVNLNNDNLNIQGLTKVASNVKLKPGYNTVKLSNPLHINKGNKFAIVVEITSEEDVGIGIEDNNDVWFGNAKSNPKESYVSNNGINWIDIYNSSNMMNLSIKAYTQTDTKNFNVSNISGKAYAGIGGIFTFSVDTSYTYSKSEIDVQILNNLGENITERFDISGNIIRGKGAFIKLGCPYDIEQGEYSVVIKKPNSSNTITKYFNVEVSTGEYVVALFKDEIFWSYVKGMLSNAISDNKNLTISAKKSEFEKVRELRDAYEKEITDITGIEYLANLKFINLNNNNISDLTPLASLAHLEELHLDLNDATDYSPLSNLSSLKILGLGGNDLSNGLSFLENLTNLEELKMDAPTLSNEVDISYIFNLHKLKKLDLSLWTWITEEHLKRIGELSNLERLYLSSCNIGNIDFIRGLNLKSLYIDNATRPQGTNHISDLSPIRNMTSLSGLSISRLPDIETLDDIANLSNLNCFWCQDCKLKDASALDGEAFKNTTWYNLWLSYNSISDNFIRSNKDLIIEVPVIIQQAANENSLLYSSNGVNLYNCEWEEYGKTIRVKANTYSYSIYIPNGYAKGLWYSVSFIDGNLGDLNNNGDIDLPDVINALRFYLGLDSITDNKKATIDFDYNGKVSLNDIIHIIRMYLGLD